VKTTNVLVIASVAALAACASKPPAQNAQLDQARAAVQELSQNPMAQQAAAQDLDSARTELAKAETMLQEGKPAEEVTHQAYLAQRHADAGAARADGAKARDDLARAEQDRNSILLEARTREAQSAQQQLQQLQAKQTSRGMTMTLGGDVLFDTGKAQLKPGADRRLDQVAMYLQENPNRKVLIEGHSDSTGNASANQDLSERRAESVAVALESRGIASSRIQTAGRGDSAPVASNDTPQGRQQNRRVELVMSDQSGRFAQGPEGGASRQ
jgi:outer membrane protein OmpA-like peptidoglycan-associated protein